MNSRIRVFGGCCDGDMKDVPKGMNVGDERVLKNHNASDVYVLGIYRGAPAFVHKRVAPYVERGDIRVGAPVGPIRES